MDTVERGEPAPRPAIDDSRRQLWTLPIQLSRKRGTRQENKPTSEPARVAGGSHAERWRRLRFWFRRRKAERRAARMRAALSYVRARLILWRYRVTSIPEEDRNRLTARFRRACYAQYRRRFVNDRLTAVFPAVVMALLVAYYALLPIALPRRYAGGYFDTLALASVGSALVLAGSLLVLSWILSYLGLRQGASIRRWLRIEGQTTQSGRTDRPRLSVPVHRWLESGFVAYPVGICAFLIAAQRNVDPVFVVILSVLGLSALYMTFFVLVWMVATISRHIARRRDPDLVMAGALADALMRLEIAPDKWPQLEFRARIAREIGEASQITRSYLLQKFEIIDTTTRLWQIHQADRIADALAQKQRWLMTPKPDTYDALRQALSRLVVAALSGAWDELARTDPAEPAEIEATTQDRIVSRVRRTTTLVFKGLRTIAVAALPAVVFWAARSRGVLAIVDQRTLDYVEIGVFVWAVLIVAFVLDPQLKERIASYKEFTMMLNPFAKREEK